VSLAVVQPWLAAALAAILLVTGLALVAVLWRRVQLARKRWRARPSRRTSDADAFSTHTSPRTGASHVSGPAPPGRVTRELGPPGGDRRASRW
jgi:hypothetical protein